MARKPEDRDQAVGVLDEDDRGFITPDLNVPAPGEKELFESVDHPMHYGGADDPYEAIKVIEAWGLDFHLGNCVKYVCRAGNKGSALEDLRKARWYLDRCIRNMEK